MISSSALAAPWYFNPRAPYGARHRGKHDPRDQPQFQSTRPIWGATGSAWTPESGYQNFNPRAPYGARLFVLPGGDSPEPISIHAPHMGRDPRRVRAYNAAREISIHAPHMGRDYGVSQLSELVDISIHAPHMGRDVPFKINQLGCSAFQSTRPIWGATSCGDGADTQDKDFNPRAPYGARRSPC